MKIAVVTASFGERRGCLFTPRDSPGVRFFAFADRRVTARGPWERQLVACPEGQGLMRAKRIKLFPWEFVPGFGAYIWIDSQCRLISDARSLVEQTGERNVGLIRKRHNCIYRETRLCVRKKKAPAAKLHAAQAHYFAEGYPTEAGLYYGGFVMLKPCAQTLRFVTEWWRLIETWHPRDQVHLPPALRYTETEPFVFPLPGPIFKEMK